LKYTPSFQPQPIVGFFHGIDPATQNDYYTDIVHVLTEKPKLNPAKLEDRFRWLPFICGILRLRKMDPNEMIDMQIRMFNKFPPMLAEVDITREDFYTNALIRKYGESKIIGVRFGNTGATNTKYQLKQVGYSYINAGYQWPDDTQIEKTQPKTAKLLRILKKEMMHEQVKYTPSGRVTFEHPIGKHNDMTHGWELSLKGVMDYQQKNLGYEKRKIDNPLFEQQQDKIYKDYPTEDLQYDTIYDRPSEGSASSLK